MAGFRALPVDGRQKRFEFTRGARWLLLLDLGHGELVFRYTKKHLPHRRQHGMDVLSGLPLDCTAEEAKDFLLSQYNFILDQEGIPPTTIEDAPPTCPDGTGDLWWDEASYLAYQSQG